MQQFHRTNLHLRVEDVEYLQRIFGRGWTTQVRDMITKKVKEIKATRQANNMEAASE